MTQPAKVQEPSMEEILASIRRIIADDDAKDPVAPAAPKSAQRPEPPAAEPPRPRPQPPVGRPMPSAVPSPARPKAAEAPARPTPPPAETNSQDDIDAMLAGLDAEVTMDKRSPELDDDVLELTEQMTVAESRKPFQPVNVSDDVEFSEPAGKPAAAAPKTVEPKNIEDRIRSRMEEELTAPATHPLMSQATMASVDSAFNALAQTVLSNNARTLEDLVREMLRPLLKSWLDDNLPGLVEKIVRAEIERVSRGR